MNPDIPGLEACKRLAKAGWTVATFFRYEKEIEEIGEWRLRQAAGRWRPAYAYVVVDAPTIGEMLAEIRRRGWGVAIDATAPYLGIEVQVFFGRDVAIADEAQVADALANALAESLEKERERP